MRSRFARNSLARFAADTLGLGFGFVASVITARALGPSGKGTLAAITFLGTFVIRASSLGLGETAIVLIGRRGFSRRRAVPATVGTVMLSSLLGGAILFAIAAVEIRPTSTALWLAIGVAALTVPFGVLLDAYAQLLNLDERIVASSGILALTSFLTVIGLAALVAVLRLAVLGGVLATTAAVLCAFIAVAYLLRGRGFLLRPRLDFVYAKLALRYGVRLELSTLLAIMAGRFDLLLVYSLASATAAGNYSVALTIGSLVSLAPFALAYASFPHISRVGAEHAAELTERACRYGVAASLLIACGVAALTPLVIPFAFGTRFEPAVVPAMVLIGGGVLSGAQWFLARAQAAAGEPNLLVWSFGATTATMVVGDVAAIPVLGTLGAALMSTLGGAVGLALCLQHLRRRGHSLRLFMPGARDFVSVCRLPTLILRPSE